LADVAPCLGPLPCEALYLNRVEEVGPMRTDDCMKGLALEPTHRRRADAEPGCNLAAIEEFASFAVHCDIEPTACRGARMTTRPDDSARCDPARAEGESRRPDDVCEVSRR